LVNTNDTAASDEAFSVKERPARIGSARSAVESMSVAHTGDEDGVIVGEGVPEVEGESSPSVTSGRSGRSRKRRRDDSRRILGPAPRRFAEWRFLNTCPVSESMMHPWLFGARTVEGRR
jgi:hypothetical protein